MTSDKAGQRRRILVIDDDPELRESISYMLDRDYDVTTAESVSESLVAFDENPPDLITLDVYMPEVNGMQGLEIFRQRSARIPIILISGHHTFELAQQALRLGANDYLTKPFTVEELNQTVRAALAKADVDEDAAPESGEDTTMRLPLQTLTADKFLSVQHRNSFLAFAQNVLSNRKPANEEMFIRELAKTIDLQVQSLRLREKVVCEIPSANHSVRIKCDMYQLGGALANLALMCMAVTRRDRSPMRIIFTMTGGKFLVTYKKGASVLPADLLARFETWQKNKKTVLDADTTMLALTEQVLRLYGGEMNVPAGSLLEISLPIGAV